VSYLDEIAEKVRAEVPTDLLPDEGDLDQLFRLYAVLVRAKGQATTNADVHDAWAAWMLGRSDNHDAVKPYEQLNSETKEQDEPFLRAIRAIAESMR
jgi:hypothetical protein